MDDKKTLVDLERKFWQSMVDQDTDAALALLCEPAVMVSAHGAMKFDHAGYRQMAEQGTMVVTAFEFGKTEVVFANDRTAVVMYDVTQTLASRGKPGQPASPPTTQQMTDSSTWVRDGTTWLCVAHTETPRAST